MKNMSIENKFLILSLVLGLIIIMIVPPFQSPDEDSHFLKAYLISKGNFYPIEKNNTIGYDIPKDMSDYISNQTSKGSDLSYKYSYENYYYDNLLSYSYSNKIFRNISTSGVTPVAHIVPAIGIFLGNLNKSFDRDGNVTPVVLLQYARLACLVVYSIICFYSLGMPVGI